MTLRRGVVTAVDPSGRPRVEVRSEAADHVTPTLRRVASVGMLAVGDRVVVADVDDEQVVVGRIV